MSTELEASHVVKCRGNSLEQYLSENAVDALIRVYRTGDVSVNCLYYAWPKNTCSACPGALEKKCVYQRA